MRAKVGIILGSPSNYDILAFKYFVLALNQIQTVYEFSFHDSEARFENVKYTEQGLVNLLTPVQRVISPGVDYLIVVTTSGIEGNLFFTIIKNMAVITTDVWEKYYSPPSLFEYLLHCITTSLLFMHPSLSLESHADTRGCVLDYARWKPDNRVDIALGYICDSDSQHIHEALGETYLTQMKLVISRMWIGSVNEFGSVAYNLKHFFRFDIGRDSGFNKTFWERAWTKFDELPKEGVKKILETIIAALLAALLLLIGIKTI